MITKEDTIPLAQLSTPLSAARLAFVSSVGVQPRGTLPFDAAHPNGDYSFRRAPSDAAFADLEIHQITDPTVGTDRDLNVIYPIEQYGRRYSSVATDEYRRPYREGRLPRRALAAAARETALPDGVQYLVGIVGAAAATPYLWTLGLLIAPCALVYAACKALHEMHDGTRQLLENMADAVDLRDPCTGGHSRRVTAYSAAILRELGLHGPEVDLIVTAARVHDIGKIGTSDAILHKPGKLDPEERAIMEEHPVAGAALLTRYRDFARGVALVRHHHESWDGTGYPDRLTGAASSGTPPSSMRSCAPSPPNSRASRWPEGRSRHLWTLARRPHSTVCRHPRHQPLHRTRRSRHEGPSPRTYAAHRWMVEPVIAVVRGDPGARASTRFALGSGGRDF